MGTQINTTTLVGPGASGKWSVPTSAGGLDANWAVNGFNDSGWTSGTTGLGFDTSAASVGKLSALESHGASALNNVQDAINLIFAGTGTTTAYTATTINYVDPQSAPASGQHFTGNANFGGNTAADDNNFALRVRGTIHIATAGQYTFGVNSDDGFSLNLSGATFSSLTNCSNTPDSSTMEFAGTRSAADSFGVTTLAVGDYEFEMYYFAGTGTSGVEFMAASGARTTFSSTPFKLVGDTANGGLPLLKVSDELAGNPSFAAAAQNVNASAFLRIPFNVADPSAVAGLNLRMKYGDGFIAYLNGEEVARSNAPDPAVWNSAATADHPTADAIRFEDFNISADSGFLLRGRMCWRFRG